MEPAIFRIPDAEDPWDSRARADSEFGVRSTEFRSSEFVLRNSFFGMDSFTASEATPRLLAAAYRPDAPAGVPGHAPRWRVGMVWGVCAASASRARSFAAAHDTADHSGSGAGAATSARGRTGSGARGRARPACGRLNRRHWP